MFCEIYEIYIVCLFAVMVVVSIQILIMYLM